MRSPAPARPPDDSKHGGRSFRRSVTSKIPHKIPVIRRGSSKGAPSGASFTKKRISRTDVALFVKSDPCAAAARISRGGRAAPDVTVGMHRGLPPRPSPMTPPQLTRIPCGPRGGSRVNLVFGTFVLAIGWLHFNTSGCLGVSLGREELVRARPRVHSPTRAQLPAFAWRGQRARGQRLAGAASHGLSLATQA